MPKSNPDYIKNTWANFHRNGDVGPLTGTSFEHTVKPYGLDLLSLKGLNVLEIGVGFGLSIKGFWDKGCNVYALDICEEAFSCVSSHIKGGFLHEEAEKLPEGFFDLAICHLVTQHMSETDILKQFPYVIRSLKPNGFLCVQFAYSDIPEENNQKQTVVGTPGDNQVSMLGGRMVRTPEYAAELIERCGGKVVYVSGMTKFPQFKSGWYYMKIVKAEKI